MKQAAVSPAGAVAAAPPGNRRGKVKAPRLKFRANRDIPIYLLLLPALGLLFVFNYIPMSGIIMSFEDYSPWKGLTGSEWVGLKHFIYFLSDGNFWRVMGNTLTINFYSILFGLPFPLIFALMLNEVRSKWFKKTLQTVSYLPYFISWVVVASIVTTVLSPDGGLVNVLLGKLGMEPTYFLTKEQYFQPILVISGIWKDFGMNAVYYIAALAGIDPQLYEAASMDGAGKWKQLFHITLPGVKNMFILLLILRVGTMVTIGFEQVFLLYNPTVYSVGDVISTYTYRLGIEQSQYSLTTAIGFTQSIVNFALVFGTNKLSKKLGGYSLW